MEIEYAVRRFRLVTENGQGIQNENSVQLRSTLGCELRKLCCIFPDRICDNCSLNGSCWYAIAFESIGNPHEARRREHPFRICLDDNVLSVSFFGEAGKNAESAIIDALIQAGNSGIGKKGSRLRFKLFDVGTSSGGWKLGGGGEDVICEKSRIILSLNTPARFQRNGRIIDRPDAETVFRSLYRRAYQICRYYGKTEESSLPDGFWKSLLLDESYLIWRDWSHYSQRQRTLMKLGGVQGNMVFSGILTEAGRSLLDFGTIAGIGKNTAFGLGCMAWEEVVR